MGSGTSKAKSKTADERTSGVKFFHNRSVSFPSSLSTYRASGGKGGKKLPRNYSDDVFLNHGHMHGKHGVADVHEVHRSSDRVPHEGRYKPRDACDEWNSLELYNAVVGETWQGRPQLLDEDYLLLLDCRSMEEYNEGHIITAVHSSYVEQPPRPLVAFHMIVLYGTDRDGIGRKLGDENFFTVSCTFEEFRSKYPFLCSKDSWNNSVQRNKFIKTWPSEILPSRLYQGTAKHALDRCVIDNLGITHIVNVTSEHPNAFPHLVEYMRIQLDDVATSDLLSWLPRTSAFVEGAIGRGWVRSTLDGGNNCVLVHCNLGRSRSSTIVAGYLMSVMSYTLQEACDWLKECRATIRPNNGFLNQLMRYENEIFGRQLSDFNKLPI